MNAQKVIKVVQKKQVLVQEQHLKAMSEKVLNVLFAECSDPAKVEDLLLMCAALHASLVSVRAVLKESYGHEVELPQ